MRRSKILAKIRSGQPAKLTTMGYFLPPYVSYAAHLGFDGIWLDLEHRVYDPREVQAILAFFHRYDIDCLLRPATREKAQLYRYLEDGVTGFMIPHVNTVEEAQALVRATKFPPVGDRGINPTGLEVDFGVSGNREQLIEHAQNETFLLVQLETPESIRSVDSIAAVDGLDGIFLGPSDLHIRMQLEPEQRQIPYSETMSRLAEACQRYGKIWGTTSQTIEDLRELRRRGANLISWGQDVHILRAGLTLAAQDLADVFAE
jgi:4-hydroxy-2-oxoheptanedioate aldolase